MIPVSLESNVQELHKFLYGTADYQVSSEVSGISGAIVSRVGQREATDEDTLRSQTYTVAPEDEAQETRGLYRRRWRRQWRPSYRRRDRRRQR